jgi:hypothetical protein
MSGGEYSPDSIGKLAFPEIMAAFFGRRQGTGGIWFNP